MISVFVLEAGDKIKESAMKTKTREKTIARREKS